MTLTKDDAAIRQLSLPQELILMLLNESRPSAGWISSHALSAKRSMNSASKFVPQLNEPELQFVAGRLRG